MCCNLLKCLLSNNCLQSVEVLKGQQINPPLLTKKLN